MRAIVAIFVAIVIIILACVIPVRRTTTKFASDVTTASISETTLKEALSEIESTKETTEKKELSCKKAAEVARVSESITTAVEKCTTNVSTTSSTTKKAVLETTNKATTTTSKTTYSSNNYKSYYSDSDVRDIAKVMYTECRGLPSKTEQACVAWCILNMCDHEGISIHSNVRKANRYAFSESTRVDDAMYNLALDVLKRWEREKNGEKDVGRVIPKTYLYWTGDGKHNYFRDNFNKPYNIWDYSLPSPYST